MNHNLYLNTGGPRYSLYLNTTYKLFSSSNLGTLLYFDHLALNTPANNFTNTHKVREREKKKRREREREESERKKERGKRERD